MKSVRDLERAVVRAAMRSLFTLAALHHREGWSDEKCIRAAASYTSSKVVKACARLWLARSAARKGRR